MRKLTLLMAAVLIANVSLADLTWTTGNLFGNIPDLDLNSDGWLVQMYRDVGNDTDLSQVTFNLDGNPSGAGNSGSDQLLASFTSELEAFEAFGTTVTFSEANLDYSSIDLFNVYTVILDEVSWGNASVSSRTFVLDQSAFLIDSSGDPSNPRTYTAPNSNPGEHEWQSVIPEPGTMALVLIGLTSLMGLRKRFVV